MNDPLVSTHKTINSSISKLNFHLQNVCIFKFVNMRLYSSQATNNKNVQLKECQNKQYGYPIIDHASRMELKGLEENGLMW